jgi:glycosyltransferase involved in cell wall biosynthesis
MKTPCLLSEGATAAEPITDGVNGYLAKESAPDMAEKILEIFSNREKMIEIGKEGSKIPITFEEMAENTLNRYNFLIDKYKKEHQK